VLPTLTFGATGGSVTLRLAPGEMPWQYGIMLTAVLALTFGASVVLVRRLSLASLLRFGEE
jgi:hypothetical protein